MFENITFVTSDIKLMVTIIDNLGAKETFPMEFNTQKKGVFKEYLERKIKAELNANPFRKRTIVTVHIH